MVAPQHAPAAGAADGRADDFLGGCAASRTRKQPSSAPDFDISFIGGNTSRHKNTVAASLFDEEEHVVHGSTRKSTAGKSKLSKPLDTCFDMGMFNIEEDDMTTQARAKARSKAAEVPVHMLDSLEKDGDGDSPTNQAQTTPAAHDRFDLNQYTQMPVNHESEEDVACSPDDNNPPLINTQSSQKSPPCGVPPPLKQPEHISPDRGDTPDPGSPKHAEDEFGLQPTLSPKCASQLFSTVQLDNQYTDVDAEAGSGAQHSCVAPRDNRPPMGQGQQLTPTLNTPLDDNAVSQALPSGSQHRSLSPPASEPTKPSASSAAVLNRPMQQRASSPPSAGTESRDPTASPSAVHRRHLRARTPTPTPTPPSQAVQSPSNMQAAAEKVSQRPKSKTHRKNSPKERSPKERSPQERPSYCYTSKLAKDMATLEPDLERLTLQEDFKCLREAIHLFGQVSQAHEQNKREVIEMVVRSQLFAEQATRLLNMADDALRHPTSSPPSLLPTPTASQQCD